MSLNINNVLINNFNNVCRTCSQTNDLVSIHENIYLIEMLSTSAQIQIQLNDELPKNICLNCIKDLNQTYAFISKCKATDAVFRQCLTQQKLLNSKENDKKSPQKSNKPIKRVETPEEVFIKTEISDNEYNNDSISDECSKDSVVEQQNTTNQRDFGECENKSEKVPETNEIHANHCSDCNKSFATNTEFILHFNDCQFKNLLVPMEQDESSDDEFQDSTLDDTSSILPDKSNASDTDEDSPATPLDMSEASSSVGYLSDKSKTQYECCYKQFKEWCRTKNNDIITEPLLLEYFEEKSQKVKSPTLWSMYSMLKCTLNIKDNIDLTNYETLVPYIKKKSIGHRPKKSIVLTRQQIETFMREADDRNYLLMKVVLIMGVSGACRRDELTNMTVDDVQDVGPVLIVKIRDGKSPKMCNNHRTFTVTNPDCIDLFRKYLGLRPPQLTNRRLFLKYHNGKCVNQVVGINKIGAIPSLIAKYLNLPNPKNYTGHCFRKTLEGDFDIVEDAKITSLNNLPEVSRKKYEMAYKLFMDWHKEQNITSITENVLMAYFAKISKQYKATTLWTHYSMLRTTININNNVDISRYSIIRAFLKRQSQSHKPKKSRTFTTNEINRFIKEAPDQEYLLIKVAFIMGIMGACRRNELHRMETTHINDLGSAVLVTLPDTKTKVVRRFTITGKFYEIFRKYADLRPPHMKDTPFFLNYQKGKCTIQRVGINKFGAMGKQVAKFLKLPNPELYTGHCLRRSSATIRLDA